MKKYICLPVVFLVLLFRCYGQPGGGIDRVEGIYLVAKEENEEAGVCRLQIVISKSKAGYVYHVITDKRNQKGKVVLTKDGHDRYIRFAGLKADEHNGDLEGLLDGDTITIQNTGNAMNEYVRLSECDKKYIVLTRQPSRGNSR